MKDLCWCSTRATTAWEPPSAPRRARPAANCNSCPAWDSDLIATLRDARGHEGPVLVLDAGDYSMGTAFGAATRETGGELQLMSRMGYRSDRDAEGRARA